jgi:hypothetical protein
MYIIQREASFMPANPCSNYITLPIHEVWNSTQTKMLAAFHNEFTARCYLNARADHHDLSGFRQYEVDAVQVKEGEWYWADSLWSYNQTHEILPSEYIGDLFVTDLADYEF